jgi:hypothetical protein
MDCPSEEQLVRMKLEGIESITKLEFDIPNRTLAVIHLKASPQTPQLMFSFRMQLPEQNRFSCLVLPELILK